MSSRRSSDSPSASFASFASKRSVMRALFFAVTSVVLAAISVGGCGDDNGVVGGSCAVPYTECSAQCVDLQTDTNNCGACGTVCQPGQPCVGGVCNGKLDGTIGDGANDGANDGSNDGSNDRGLTDGGREDALGDDADGGLCDGCSEDARGDDAEAGTRDGGDGGPVCIPPFNTNQQCGDCFTQCVAPNDTCKPADGGFSCQPFCVPPLTNCSGQCYDLQNDGLHCGTCTNVCPTLLCQNGMCRGGINGDLAFIGHDYSSSIPFPGPQSTVLTNAVFVRTSNPIRVLAYQRYANATSIARVTNILTTFATNSGRTLQLSTTTTDGDIPSRLTISAFETLLVYDEETAPAGALATLGASWRTTLATYLAAGGVVVVLDGAAGNVKEMPAFMSSAGMLNITTQTTVNQGTQVNNVAPGDSIGKNVGLFYAATNRSARFVTEAPSASVTYVVVEPVSGQPLVVHKTF